MSYDSKPFHSFFYRISYLVLPMKIVDKLPAEWQERWKAVIAEFAENVGSQWPWPQYGVRAHEGNRFVRDPHRDGGDYIVFPRLALEAQPPEWQHRAIALLHEAHELYGFTTPSYWVKPVGYGRLDHDGWAEYKYGSYEEMMRKAHRQAA